MTITDHKPLCSMVCRKKEGSIRIESIKLKNQDIPYTLFYQKGKMNRADFLSQLCTIWKADQRRKTPTIGHIGLRGIANAIKIDGVLEKITSYLKNGQEWIPKFEDSNTLKFQYNNNKLFLSGSIPRKHFLVHPWYGQENLILC